MARRPRWRLVLASVAFAAWAPPSLLGLPFASLAFASGPRTQRERAVALAVGVASLVLLLAGDRGILDGFLGAYVVLVSAAFVALTLVAPARFLQQAWRASLLALVVALALARAVLGRQAGDMLRWEATRQWTTMIGLAVSRRPEAFPFFVPAVQFLAETVPAMLVLQACAGLALAWQWHQLVASDPLGEPLGPFREFRFADAWVWGVVAGVGVWVTPLLAGLKIAALNLLVVLGAFYLLRGAAVAVVFASAIGFSPAALAAGLVVAAVLAVPLLFIVPGLATLGVSDTWLEFRRRLASRPNVS